MNTLNFSDQKSFTNDSRTNYLIYNQSNIFNNDNNNIRPNNKVENFKNRNKENNYEPKYKNENAFEKKMKEFHKEESFITGSSNKKNLNNSYIKPPNNNNNSNNEKKIDRDLTPKEKKLFEQNPQMNFTQLKNLSNNKINNNNIFDRNNNAISLNNNNSSSKKNKTLFTKVNFNHSNIFNDAEKESQNSEFRRNKKSILDKANFMNKENTTGNNYDIIKNDNCTYATQKKTVFNKRSASMDDEVKPLVNNLVEDKHNAKNKKMLSLVSEMDEFYKDQNKFKIHKKEKNPNPEDDYTQNKNNLKTAINTNNITGTIRQGRASSAINNSRLEKIYEQTSCFFNKDFYDTNLNSKKIFYFYTKLILL